MIENPHGYRMVPIDNVIPYPNNPRLNDDAVEAVANSIQAFGWQQPITVDKDMVVITGHTRLKAAYLLDQTEVPVQVADNLTPDEVAAYRLADNKVGEIAIWDYDILGEELKNIQMDMGEWFDDNDFVSFSDLFNDGEIPAKEVEESSEPREITCPSCGERFTIDG